MLLLYIVGIIEVAATFIFFTPLDNAGKTVPALLVAGAGVGGLFVIFLLLVREQKKRIGR